MKCDFRDEKCTGAGHDCAYCNIIDVHLCDTCQKTYPECDGENMKFGCDIDTEPRTRQSKDNIFSCDGYVKRTKKPTNADRIHSMSDEELAEIILCPYDTAGKPAEIMPCAKDGIQELAPPEDCKKCMMKWLQSEAEE